MVSVVFEYEQSVCCRFDKKITMRSMIVEVFDQATEKRLIGKQAFDCNQKVSYGVLSILGKSSIVDWSGCTHSKLAEKKA